MDQALGPHEELLRTSRLRIKLLADKRRSFDEVLENADALTAINSGWFTNMHHGILGPLKAWMQPDLGVYFVQSDIVCTTHVAFLNMGLTEQALSASSLSLDTLGPFMHRTAIDFGRYAGLLASSVGIEDLASETATGPLPPPVGFRDLKSKRLYGSMARRVAPGQNSVCLLLTSVLSQINTARFLAPMIAGENDVAAFKVRFLSLFHAASGLHSLLGRDRADSFLLPDAKQRLGDALNALPIQSVLEDRDLRNILMHYRVGKRAVPRLSLHPPLFGLVEAHAPQKSFASLKRDVELGLDRLADGLHGMLPRTLTPEETL